MYVISQLRVYFRHIISIPFYRKREPQRLGFCLQMMKFVRSMVVCVCMHAYVHMHTHVHVHSGVRGEESTIQVF